VAAIHRNVSLYVVVFVVIHVVTSVLDGFAPIALTQAVIPFVSPYRPLWLGLGALSFDLLVALVATSLLRARIGTRAWRTVHWLSYLCWPVAVLHGLGAGSDPKQMWLLAVTAACVAAMIAAVWARLAVSGVGYAPRAWGSAAVLLLPVGLVVWAVQGPLASGWARRAGTPAALLRGGGAPRTVAGGLPDTFAAVLRGRLSRASSPGGGAEIDFALRMRGATRGALTIRVSGRPDAGGGLAMTSSEVLIGPPDRPTLYRGALTQVDNDRLQARVSAAGQRSLALDILLRADAGGEVRGSLRAAATA
jgi:DMSO/TMAO reductase YedYZ heme-binding membrane subunit